MKKLELRGNLYFEYLGYEGMVIRLVLPDGRDEYLDDLLRNAFHEDNFGQVIITVEKVDEP